MTAINETDAAIKKTTNRRFLRRATEAVFPFGAIFRAKTNDPHSALENLERASAAATLWILAGIVIELGWVIWSAHGGLEMAVGVSANALIGLGLIFEYVVIGRAIVASGEAQRESDEKISLADLNAAEANRAATEAQLKLEELKKRTAPREIDSTEFLRVLRGKPKAKVEVLYVRDDVDSFHLALGISSLLREAHWDVVWARPIAPEEFSNPGVPSGMAAGGQPAGVTVVGRLDPREKDAPAPWADDSTWQHTPFTGLTRALNAALGGVSCSQSLGWAGGDTLRVVVSPKR
jgi:hypothetical protein